GLSASLKLPGVDDTNLDARRVPQSPDSYEIFGVPPGQIALSFFSRENGGVDSLQSKTMRISSDGQVDLVPRGSLVSVTGEIVDGNEPGARRGSDEEADDANSRPHIQFTSADGANSYSASIDAEGHFALSIPAGQYLIEFLNSSPSDVAL